MHLSLKVSEVGGDILMNPNDQKEVEPITRDLGMTPSAAASHTPPAAAASKERQNG